MLIFSKIFTDGSKLEVDHNDEVGVYGQPTKITIISNDTDGVSDNEVYGKNIYKKLNVALQFSFNNGVIGNCINIVLFEKHDLHTIRDLVSFIINKYNNFIIKKYVNELNDSTDNKGVLTYDEALKRARITNDIICINIDNYFFFADDDDFGSDLDVNEWSSRIFKIPQYVKNERSSGEEVFVDTIDKYINMFESDHEQIESVEELVVNVYNI